MSQNVSAGTPTCALEGCSVPILRKSGGGRPRLYCSDAHRAEARRRRLGSEWSAVGLRGDSSGVERPLDDVRALLTGALAGLDRAERAAPRDDAVVAAIRAEATAEVLRAQQSAADGAREAAAVHERLARERGEWRELLDALVGERDELARVAEELSGALEGAREELEQELLRHHVDAERAESLLQAQRVAHTAEMERATSVLDELRQRLASVAAAADEADQRAGRAEQLLVERTEATLEVEVRAARAEEQSRQASVRVEEAREELSRLRRELAGERRHHRAVESELRRRMGQASPPAGARSRRAPTGSPAAATRS